MKALGISALLIALGLSACSSIDECNIYSLNEKIRQYQIYDAKTGKIIFQCAYELMYNYDTDEYSAIIPFDYKEPVTESTKFTEYTFNKHDVIIIDSESGNTVIPGTI